MRSRLNTGVQRMRRPAESLPRSVTQPPPEALLRTSDLGLQTSFSPSHGLPASPPVNNLFARRFTPPACAFRFGRMSVEYDTTEFVDTDFQTHKTLTALTGVTATGPAAHSASLTPRAPSREEVDARLTDTQRQIAELQRAQEEVQRKRDALAEVRRRQTEFETGRPEMIAHLTRGMGLLEKAEFTARRDAEQMARALADFQEALRKLQKIDAQTWSQESFDVELTRALTSIENARMEWNSARLKFPVLAGENGGAGEGAEVEKPAAPALTELSLLQLCKLGLGLTLPLAIVALLATGLLAVIWLRGH